VSIAEKLWSHGETVLFWLLAVLCVLPVWSFRYVPTQDGPSHLANAQILRDYGNAVAGYEAIFEIRDDPIPNWTSHLLLAGLLYLFPALIAEKVLVSLYLLGFAGAFRYFLGSFGERCRPLSWAGLLLLYNRCFWMGFYNYCLSLILVWVILGFCIRRRASLRLPEAAVLMLLFAVTYFTHLAGFGLAVAGAVGAGLLLKPWSLRRPALIVLAILPSALLTMDYFESSGFFRMRSDQGLMNHATMMVSSGRLQKTLGLEWRGLDDELFVHHAGADTIGLCLVFYFLVVGGLGVLEFCLGERQEDGLAQNTESGVPEVDDSSHSLRVQDSRRLLGQPPGPGRLFPVVLGIFVLACYLLLPNHVAPAGPVLTQGGFLKARFALMVPLVWLACFREPGPVLLRFLVRGLTAGLLAANLLLVTQTFQTGNKVIAEYTAGIEAVGRGHRLTGTQPQAGDRLVNPLLHAIDYYSLGTDNVNLENYEASTPHFPVKYRQRGAGGTNRQADTMIYWRASPPAGNDWEEIFAQGQLRIFRRGKPR
jgi:hypothetical protein